jgi:hypothetical protein
MFNVFVGRDEKRELLADQLVRFEWRRDADKYDLTARVKGGRCAGQSRRP